MIVLALAACHAGFLALSLGMSRHHREVLGKPLPAHRGRGLQGAGWTALALGFAAAVKHSGWQVGPVLWIALLTAGAVLVVLPLSYAPRRLFASTAALWALAMLSLLAGA